MTLITSKGLGDCLGESEGEAWLVIKGVFSALRGHTAAGSPGTPGSELTCISGRGWVGERFSGSTQGHIGPPPSHRRPSLFLGESLLIGKANCCSDTFFIGKLDAIGLKAIMI